MLRQASLLAALVLSGCWSTDTQTREQANTVVGPVAFDTPIGQFTAQQFEIKQERTQTETSKTQVDPAPSIAAATPFIPGGPLAGGLAGIAGAAFGAWRMLREKAANKALTQTVAGIEDFKSQHEPEVVEKLHHALGRKMDTDAKKRVKHARVNV